jgi:uncharacterized protein YjbJ (UPF0337 family)
MKEGTKDQVKGQIHEAKGKVKEKVGHAIHSSKLESEGKSENLAGKIQKKVGEIEDVLAE